MDFHDAFFAIDEDRCGEISRADLENYMRRMKYQEEFVHKWLNLFDIDHNGTISYEEYCTTLGLVPKTEIPKTEGPKKEIVQKEVVTKCSSAVSGARSEDDKTKRTPASGKRNSLISRRLMRFSRARVIQKKALYRYKPATVRGTKKEEKKTTSTSQKSVTKEISGSNNGETREVPQSRSPRFYPTEDIKRRKSSPKKHFHCDHTRKLKRNLKPGSVLILLTGRHRGKRVVFLKQLESGLLLVTGPYKINGCPLRRVHQNYVIGTSTKLNIEDEEIPSHLNDKYFRRQKTNRKREAKDGGDIFQKKKHQYELQENRKEDQKTVDTIVLSKIQDHEECSMLRSYLKTMFGLRRCDKPHELIF